MVMIGINEFRIRKIWKFVEGRGKGKGKKESQNWKAQLGR